MHDPDGSPELVERLGHDEAVWVRTEAAGDPRLPGARIDELLRDWATAQNAAANPALPTAEMHRLLDEPGIPA